MTDWFYIKVVIWPNIFQIKNDVPTLDKFVHLSILRCHGIDYLHFLGKIWQMIISPVRIQQGDYKSSNLAKICMDLKLENHEGIQSMEPWKCTLIFSNKNNRRMKRQILFTLIWFFGKHESRSSEHMERKAFPFFFNF